MSKGEFNYLSLENGEDKKEPLIGEEIFRNDSTFFLQEANLDNYKKQQDEAIKKLTSICVICTIFIIIEIIGGYIANSIALMSIAAYLLSDLFGLIISIISIYTSRKIAKNNMIHGYHTSEIIGALVSIMLIWSLTIWLLYEATMHIIITPQVNGLIMIIISIIGFFFNVIMSIILAKNEVQNNNSFHGKDHQNQDHEQITLNDAHQNKNENVNVNLKVPSIHVLGDVLQNLGVLISGGIIFFFPKLSIVDPVCCYIISFIVVIITIRILKDCIFILMEGNPVEIDIEQLEKDLKYIEGVKDIYDLHVWRMSTGEVSLSCYICCNEPEKTLKRAKKLFEKKYRIDTINIQV